MNDRMMSRRRWLKAAGALAAAWTLPSSTAAEQAADEEGFLLSEEGCGRATGYAKNHTLSR